MTRRNIERSAPRRPTRVDLRRAAGHRTPDRAQQQASPQRRTGRLRTAPAHPGRLRLRSAVTASRPRSSSPPTTPTPRRQPHLQPALRGRAGKANAARDPDRPLENPAAHHRQPTQLSDIVTAALHLTHSSKNKVIVRSFRAFLKSKMIPLAIAAVVVGGGVTALSVAASAAPTKSSTTSSAKAKANSKPNSKPKAKGSPCTAIGHVIKNKRDAGVRRTWPRGANWRASATAKGSVVTLQHEERVHNSVSATVGVTNSVVSAALGFNVEFQKAVWVGFSYTTPKAGRYELRVTPGIPRLPV